MIYYILVMKKSDSVLSVFLSLFIFLFFRVSSWLCSIPMWATLILHFTIGLNIWWFWATLFAWLLAGVIRFALINFGRWGANETAKQLEKENKNPYSNKK